MVGHSSTRAMKNFVLDVITLTRIECIALLNSNRNKMKNKLYCVLRLIQEVEFNINRGEIQEIPGLLHNANEILAGVLRDGPFYHNDGDWRAISGDLGA